MPGSMMQRGIDLSSADEDYLEAQVSLPVSAYDHAYRRHEMQAQTYGNGPTHHMARATIPRHMNNDYIKR